VARTFGPHNNAVPDDRLRVTSLHGDLDPSQVHTVAHTKRFLERLRGDPEFRREAREAPSARQRLLDRLGIDLRDTDLAPFWRLVEQGRAHCLTTEDLLESPLGQMWISALDATNQRVESTGPPCEDRRFEAWRQRRICGVSSETSLRPDSQIFPVVAFELSKGCSVQCWFCALDPPRLEAYFPYTSENAGLWRDVLNTVWKLFGPACRASVCYHATEPTDNPDYLRFLEDFHDIYGVRPQTTTARPLKDLGWTRELLRLREACPAIPDRFSVLTVQTLRRIHEVFSADDLKYVELLLHNQGALAYKVHCGRALERADRLAAAERVPREYDARTTVLPQQTIECTCGYVVNMVDRNIRLVSPCNASDRWPLGVKVHAEGSFRDVSELGSFVEWSIDECMPEYLGRDVRLAFRADLTYEKADDGFVLTSLFVRHCVKGGPRFVVLGDLIAQGNRTTAEVTEGLIQGGVPALEALSLLDQLHRKGLLSEDGDDASSASGGHLPRRRSTCSE
jgi:radical SAM family RiPP maturation amino acid epimerase